jgi:hypothetical protein
MLRGDLDGDLCFITWDDKLIPKKVDPMDYCNEVTHNGPCCYTRGTLLTQVFFNRLFIWIMYSVVDLPFLFS